MGFVETELRLVIEAVEEGFREGDCFIVRELDGDFLLLVVLRLATECSDAECRRVVCEFVGDFAESELLFFVDLFGDFTAAVLELFIK